jgi:hypothetical protein
MDGLYNKVIKGQYEKICDKYSKDISEILKLLFKVNPKDRPSCGQILKHPLIKKRLEFFRAQAGSENVDFDDIDEGVLLRTIRIPKNILNLAEKLPESNYDYLPGINNKKKRKNKDNSNSNSTLPDIQYHTSFNKENNNSYIENNKNILSIKNNKINDNNIKNSTKKRIINIKLKNDNLSLGKIIPNNNIDHKTNNSLSKKNCSIRNNVLTEIQSLYKTPSELNKAKSIDKNNVNLPKHKKFYINQKVPKKIKVDNFLKDLGININYDDYLQSIKNNKRNITLTIPNLNKVVPNKKLGPIINKKKKKE